MTVIVVRRYHKKQKIAISPQANAYDVVKHFDTQKVPELRGEALRRPKVKVRYLKSLFNKRLLWKAISESLLLLQVKSVLMPSRKELGQLEGRKPKVVGIKVMQFRGLAAPR